jgi:hypothetical protein
VAPAALHEIAMRQIHLMASVYTQLRLEDERALEHPWHRGWMETFRRWMASASFRRVWLVGMQSYGPWFRKFCDENFGVSIELRWAPCTREELARHDVDLPPASPDAGARYFLCTISAGPGIELGVASARVGHDPAADGAGPRLDRRQRPGFLGLMSSPEAQEGLDDALAGVGLPAQREC